MVILLCGGLVVAAISFGQAVVPGVIAGRVFNESSGRYLQNACVTIDGSTAIGATSRATLAEALAVQAGQRPSLADDPSFKATIAKLAAASSLQPDLKVLEDKAKDGTKPAAQ